MEIHWINEGTPAYFELECVVKDKTLLNDMKHFAEFCHTGQLEVYHPVINRFFPKRLHFSWNGMTATTRRAILDHNSGKDSDYVKTKDGQERFKLAFSKVTQNWTTKQIKSSKSKVYLSELMKFLS